MSRGTQWCNGGIWGFILMIWYFTEQLIETVITKKTSRLEHERTKSSWRIFFTITYSILFFLKSKNFLWIFPSSKYHKMSHIVPFLQNPGRQHSLMMPTFSNIYFNQYFYENVPLFDYTILTDTTPFILLFWTYNDSFNRLKHIL